MTIASWHSRSVFVFAVAGVALHLMAAPESRAQVRDPALAELVVPADRIPPPLSFAKRKYFLENPAAWSEFVAQLPLIPAGAPGEPESPGVRPAFGGSWQAVTTAPAALCSPELLTDGTVVAQSCSAPQWYKLTPDIKGSYATGSWSEIASLPVIGGTQYAPLYTAAAVLPDGRLIIMGGEYNQGNDAWTNLGAIYNPLTNEWTAVTPYSGMNGQCTTLPEGGLGGCIGDAQSVVLPNGTFMLGSCCNNPDIDVLLNATTLGWTTTGAPSVGGDKYQDEQGYELLPNGKVLTVDIWSDKGLSANPTGAELYTPSTGTWSNTGSTPASLVDPYQCGNFEIGPAAQRPDGTLVGFGANSGCSALVTANGAAAAADPTAIYDVSAGTWTAGPKVPEVCTASGNFPTKFCTLADAPAAVLPDGNILFAAASGYAVASGTQFFEFTSATSTPANSIKQVASQPGASGSASYIYDFLVLPTGEVFSTNFSATPQIYVPTGSPDASWAPTITTAPSTVVAGATYQISGAQFNGLTQGGYYGDDYQGATNYPLVRITNSSTGDVFYARTFGHSHDVHRAGCVRRDEFHIAREYCAGCQQSGRSCQRHSVGTDRQLP